MRIYIAGSISENPNYEQQFAEMEKKLIAEGHAVVNPVKNLGFEYKDYIDMGLCELMHCEAIYLLKGYENSKGALLEKHYAEAVGMAIFFEQDKTFVANGMNYQLPKNLKNILNEKGMTQRQLAEKIGTTETSISRYVNGERVPKATDIKKIAFALNVTLEDLLK